MQYTKERKMHMKRLTAIMLILIFTLCSLCACTSSDPMVLFFSVDTQAGSFDPQIADDTTAKLIAANCFEGLVRYDENGDIVNGVAEKYTVSSDGLTYTFYLRKDAVWHLTSNAQKQLEKKLPENFDLSVTAYDFQFALQRAADPDTGAQGAYMLGNILNYQKIASGELGIASLGVKAVDKYTLEITLSQPQSNFPEILTEPICMPCNETFFNACSGRYGTLIAFFLSNGPFYLSRFDETSYRINKSPDYVGESSAVPDYIWLYVNEDDEGLISSLEEHDYSGAVLNDALYSLLEVDKKMTVTESPDTLCCFIMNPNDSVFCENDMRLALAAATDVSTIAQNASRAKAEGFVPISCADKLSVSPEVYNEQNAAAYLKSGLAKLEQDSVSVTLLCETKYEEIMKKQLQEWQRILGISVSFTVKTADAAQVTAAFESGNYQLIFYPLTSGGNSAFKYFGSLPLSVYGVKTNVISEDGEENTASNIDENAVSGDYILSLILSLYSSDSEHFGEVYKELESRLAASSVILPVWNENSYFVCTKNIKNVMYFSSRDSLYFHKATDK